MPNLAPSPNARVLTDDDIIAQMSVAIANMPRDRVIKWVLALESRLYNQGHGDLVSYPTDYEPHYCCLGIYDHVVLGRDESQVRMDSYHEGENAGTIPEELAGDFTNQRPFFGCNDGGEFWEEATTDSPKIYYHRRNFIEIASLIRRARPDVFNAPTQLQTPASS